MKKDLDMILSEKNAQGMLLYSESYKTANMYYLTGFLAPDPFVFLKQIDREPLLVVNQMEFPRAKKESHVKDVHSYFDYDYVQIMKTAPDPRIGLLRFIAMLAKEELEINKPVYVPYDLPVMLADALRHEDLKIQPMFGVVEKTRETKEPGELDSIESTQRVVEYATEKAMALIKDADVGPNNVLLYRQNGRKQRLTAGRVRAVFNHAFVDNGCISEEETIIACGQKGADPHYSGRTEDNLKANQPIVIDVFPRNVKERYVSDMTRTIVKGKASKTVKKMYETVLEIKNICTDSIKAGISGRAMQNLCCDLMEKAGYETTRGGKQIDRGYLHSLGHGVGLEIHEEPKMSEFHSQALEEHNVVSVEPGLYDPKIGGMRIEDLVEVTRRGCRNLTRMDIFLEV